MPIIPTPDLPLDGTGADVGDYNPIIIAILALLNGGLDGDNINHGTLPWSVMDQSMTNTIPGSVMQDDANLEKFRSETFADMVSSGCLWTATTGRSAVMSSGVVYISGKRLVVSAVAARVFTASRDTYVSISNTGTINYVEVANNGSSPSLGANALLLAVVKTNASSITSIRTTGVDDNGNIVRNTSILGDTGWIDCTYASGFTAGTPGQLRVRRVGKTVTLQGGATGTIPANIYQTVANLPKGMFPSSTIYGGAMGSSMTPAAVQVVQDTGASDAGNIRFGRDSSVSLVPPWIAASVTWFLD